MYIYFDRVSYFQTLKKAFLMVKPVKPRNVQ